MEIGAAPAPARRKALGQHADKLLEFSSGEGAVRVGAHKKIVEASSSSQSSLATMATICCAASIQRPRRHLSLIEIAAADGFEQRRALHQIVAAQWKSTGLSGTPRAHGRSVRRAAAVRRLTAGC